MSNFSFSRSVFKRLVLQTQKKYSLFGKGLIINSSSVLVFSALVIQFVSHRFTEYHDPTIGKLGIETTLMRQCTFSGER